MTSNKSEDNLKAAGKATGSLISILIKLVMAIITIVPKLLQASRNPGKNQKP